MISYLFIDAGCVRGALDRIAKIYGFDRDTLEIDFDALTRGFSKVFYYDALPERKADEDDTTYRERTSPQRRVLDKLSVLDRFHVYEGDVRRSSSRRGPEQKKIDVMIAVDMLTHSFRRNMQEATLLTGDLDFKPLIDALVHEGMIIRLWYPPNETARELRASADSSRPLHVREVFGALSAPHPFQLPSSYSGPDRGEIGIVLARWEIDGKEALLLQPPYEATFVAALPNVNPGYKLYCQHPRLDILRTYVGDMFELQIPLLDDEISKL